MSRTISVVLCLFFAVAVVSGAIKYRKCGPANIKKVFIEGTENIAAPIIYRNKNYTIKIDYTAGEKVHGFDNLKTTWYAILNTIPVPWDMKMAPGCEATTPTCPIVANHNYVYHEMFTVPRDAPPMRAVVKMVQSAGNEDHLCLILSLIIK